MSPQRARRHVAAQNAFFFAPSQSGCDLLIEQLPNHEHALSWLSWLAGAMRGAQVQVSALRELDLCNTGIRKETIPPGMLCRVTIC